YKPGDTVKIDGDDITFTAVYAQAYKVTYDKNLDAATGSQTDTKSPYYDGSTVTVLNEGTMKAEGYTFQGWNSDQTKATAGTVEYAAGDTFTIKQATTLYAVWEAIPQYTVTYNKNLDAATGSQTDAKSPYYSGTTVTVLNEGTMKAENYDFLGWNTDQAKATAGTVEFKANDTFEIKNDTVLYAVWDRYYTVDYDADGGKNEPEDTKHYHNGDEVTVPNGEPEKDGEKFVGWTTDPSDPDAKVLGAGDTVKIDGKDITFTAVYTPVYKVTYDKNLDAATGSQTDTKSPYDKGETVTVLDQGTMKADGYKFIGWSRDKDATASDSKYDPNAEFQITEDTTLYAVWTPVYKVVYDPAGGSNEPTDTKEYLNGEEVKVPSDIPVKKGFEFKGWTTDPADPDAPLYKVGDAVLVNGEDITFTAVWEKINNAPVVVYKAIYDPAGGVPTPEDTTEYVDGATVIVTADVPARDGYTFLGWSLDPSDPDAKLLKSGDTTTINSSDVTFTAIWTKHYVVIYDKNADDATGTQKDLNNPYESGETVTVLGAGNVFRPGFAFKGWAKDASATAASFTEGNTFVITADTTLYAVWEELPSYKAIYDPNGGSDAPVDETKYQDGATVTVSDTVPVKDGFIFEGWTLDPSDPDAKLLKGGDTTAVQGGDVTFTAVWTKDPNGSDPVIYKVTYDPQGGAPTPADTTEYVDGATVIVTKDVPVKDGFELDGWTLDPKAETPVVLKGGDTVKIGGSDLTIYAVWVPVYTVDYDADGASSTPKDEKKYRNGDKAIVMKDIPVKEGKTFKGWTTDPADTANLLQNGDTVTINGKNVVLYAVFETIASSDYAVTYDLNGSKEKAPVDTNRYTSGSSVTIVNDIPKRSGYTFTGWSLKSDGSADFQGGDTYKISTDTTFYAVWTPNASGAKTGDPLQVLPWLLMALLSMAGASAAVIRGKKKAK
ncbi:MAG: InlB B-repeat-containing protein, partial [Lachnospiraceae bacterium]|nr:InlB B-repeat-containing protein [Lachnospiraceae bacterium]